MKTILKSSSKVYTSKFIIKNIKNINSLGASAPPLSIVANLAPPMIAGSGINSLILHHSSSPGIEPQF